jgi:ketosteroid isomerase-like protein
MPIRDIDSIVSLFADDATVIDEGEERHGTAEIRAWQTGALRSTSATSQRAVRCSRSTTRSPASTSSDFDKLPA